MKTKIVLVFVIILVTGIGVFVKTQLNQTPAISRTLSARAQEYIKEKKSTDDAQWRMVNLSSAKANQKTNQHLSIGTCFGMTVPFVITDSQLTDVCSATIKIDNPKGTIVVSEKTVGFDTIAGSPDVMFREQHADQYKQIHETVNGKTYVEFVSTDSLYQKSAFTMISGKYLTISLTTSTNENLDRQFTQLLSSLAFTN